MITIDIVVRDDKGNSCGRQFTKDYMCGDIKILVDELAATAKEITEYVDADVMFNQSLDRFFASSKDSLNKLFNDLKN